MRAKRSSGIGSTRRRDYRAWLARWRRRDICLSYEMRRLRSTRPAAHQQAEREPTKSPQRLRHDESIKSQKRVDGYTRYLFGIVPFAKRMSSSRISMKYLPVSPCTSESTAPTTNQNPVPAPSKTVAISARSVGRGCRLLYNKPDSIMCDSFGFLRADLSTCFRFRLRR